MAGALGREGREQGRGKTDAGPGENPLRVAGTRSPVSGGRSPLTRPRLPAPPPTSLEALTGHFLVPLPSVQGPRHRLWGPQAVTGSLRHRLLTFLWAAGDTEGGQRPERLVVTTRRPCVSGARREAGHSLCRQPPPPPPAASGRSRGGSERGSLAPPSRDGCQRLPGLAGHQQREGKSRFSGAEHAQVWVEGWTDRDGWTDG